MLTRIISAVVAIAIFITVVYFLPPICFTVAVAAVCAIAAYEITWRSGIVKVCALSCVACTFAFVMPFFVADKSLGMYIFVLMFAAVLLLFAVWLFNYGRASLVMVLTSFFAATVLPLMFSLIVRIHAAENGNLWILFPFLAAWMTDTGAYFTGVFLGKHKLCEKISPKKTVEGAIGGVVVCVISLSVYAYAMGLQVGFPVVFLGAAVLSVIAQIGDLSFSVIKREYNIKDYGNLMPGHGGVLDRFDSTMFTIPASYILLMIIGGIL